MFEPLVWATGLFCVVAFFVAWRAFRDVFHPLILTVPMFAFFYVLMPLYLIRDGQIFSYVSESQCTFVQAVLLGGVIAFVLGCFLGSHYGPKPSWKNAPVYDHKFIQKSGYLLGGIGLAAWMFTVQNAGGIADVFSRPKGMGWSYYGYVREAAYLMIVGLLLLLSPQGYDPKNRRWRIAVAAFATPYMIQGLLGAQRGPTFLAFATLGLSWYLARRKRPALVTLLAASAGLGFLMLFLVINRGAIYIGSDQELKTDVHEFLTANEANEYIFGAGCITAAHQSGDYFWGRRYLAQIIVRPIPRQIWPTKYVDFGIPEIEQNAGVAGAGLEAVMGWREVPGAAATMIPDVWVEFSWFAFPFLALVGWGYGYAWRRAVWQGGPWTTLFTIFCLLSVYFISQSGEAVIFRLVILSVPSLYAWRKAALPFVPARVPYAAPVR